MIVDGTNTWEASSPWSWRHDCTILCFTACPSFNQSCTYCSQLYVCSPFHNGKGQILTADFFEENTWRNAKHPSLYPHVHPHIDLHLHPYCWCFGDYPSWCGCCPRFLPTFLPRSKDGHYNMINMVIYPLIRIFFTIYVPVVRILNIGWMTVNNISFGWFYISRYIPIIS